MHALSVVLDPLCHWLYSAVLWVLLRSHALYPSWAFSILVLATLYALLHFLLLMLVSRAGVFRRREAHRRASADLTEDEIEAQLNQDFPIPLWLVVAAKGANIALQVAGYGGLYLVLRDAPALRGQPLLWWRDVSAPDPYHVSAVVFLLAALVCVVQALRRRPRTLKEVRVFVLAGVIGVPLFVVVPVGVIYFTLLNFLSAPKYLFALLLAPGYLLLRKLRPPQAAAPAPSGPRPPPARPLEPPTPRFLP